VTQAVLEFGQLLLRGLKKVGGEWALVCLAYNVKRLHRLGAGLGLAWAGLNKPGPGRKAGHSACRAVLVRRPILPAAAAAG
jgi:hypothetical protein